MWDGVDLGPATTTSAKSTTAGGSAKSTAPVEPPPIRSSGTPSEPLVPNSASGDEGALPELPLLAGIYRQYGPGPVHGLSKYDPSLLSEMPLLVAELKSLRLMSPTQRAGALGMSGKLSDADLLLLETPTHTAPLKSPGTTTGIGTLKVRKIESTP